MRLNGRADVSQFFLHYEMEAVESGGHMAQSCPFILQLFLPADYSVQGVFPCSDWAFVNAAQLRLEHRRLYLLLPLR
jgi:hypothetical protein